MEIRPVETEADWKAMRRIRQRVFVEEQACPPEEEWDRWDAPTARGRTCHHLLGLIDDEPVATARWRIVEHDGEQMAKLERFAVLQEVRGNGHGRTIIAAAIRDARAAGHTAYVLHAQSHLQGLYASFGFRRTSGEYEEAGIPHVTMERRDAANREE